MGSNVTVPQSVHSLVPGTLSLVGGAVPADDRQCWAPESPGRWLPMQTYVLQDGDSAVIVDTSVTALRPQLAEGLQHLLGENSTADVVMTRYNFDTLVNFPWLRRTFKVEHLYTSLLAGFVLGTDEVMSFVDAFEEAHTEAQVKWAAGVEPMGLPQNADFEAGGRKMRCVAAPLRLLLTNWVYDYDTKTLFSSDSWGIGTVATPTERPVIESSDHHSLTRDAVATALVNRFDWLAGADTDPVRKAIDDFFDTYPVERIAPSHGAVIEGAENVALVREYSDEVLKDFRTTPLPRLVVDSDSYPTRVIKAEELRLKESA